MPHVVLLGDSVFDNAAYVGGGPDVVRQLGDVLPSGWSATLRAVDGSVIDDVPRQLRSLPEDTTHLVLSAGGNDALGHVDMLDRPVRSSAEVLEHMSSVRRTFAARYRAMLTRVLEPRLPLVVCTIYEGNFDDEFMQRLTSTALTVFNDAILRAAFAARLPVIDLRAVCCDSADYANPIEPSVAGGAKIARAILKSLRLGPAEGSVVIATG